MDQNSSEWVNLKSVADRLEVRFNPREPEEQIRAKVARAILERGGSSIAAAETALGKSLNDFTDAEENFLLGLHIYASTLTAAKMKLKRDTYYSMSWSEYKNVLFENGFDKVYSYNFNDPTNTKNIEEYSIFARKERGFLLTAESYNAKKVVNSTHLYFELGLLVNGEKPGELEEMAISSVLDCSSNSPCFDDKENQIARRVSFDAREGLVNYLSSVESVRSQLNVPWKFFRADFLWLADFSETNGKHPDYSAIDERKLSALPSDIKQMMGFIK